MTGAWEQPPAKAILCEGEVHVWRAGLERTAEELERFSAELSADEQERAARFRVQEARARFTAARATLRRILGAYLDVGPAELRFGYAKHGKPFLDRSGGDDVRFNVSHSHRLALYAIALGTEVGIDLEQIRADRDHERLARRFFSAEETEALLAVPAEGRIEAFFQCWTRKEAYLKARGEGLAVPLRSFTVSLGAGRPAALLDVAGEPSQAGRWALENIDASPGYAAALAIDGPPLTVRLFDW